MLIESIIRTFKKKYPEQLKCNTKGELNILKLYPSNLDQLAGLSSWLNFIKWYKHTFECWVKGRSSQY